MLSRNKLINTVRKVDIRHIKGKRGSTVAFLKKKPSAKICVIRSVGGIGDILMITPSLMEIKKRFPKCILTFAVDRHTTNGDTYYELLKNAPFIDRLIDARYVKHNTFDHTIDISSVCIGYERRGLPPRNRISIFADHLGLTYLDDKVPFYSIHPEERGLARDLVASFRGDSNYVVMISVGSMEGRRCWPQAKEEKWPEFVRHLRSRVPGIKFIVNDFTNKARSLAKLPYVLYLENTSVRQLAAITDECDYFVGPDSGPMHIAGALGVPSSVIFGSIPPEARINFYPSHSSITVGSLPCLGCWYAHCPYNVKCMRDLTVLSVAEQVRSKLLGAKYAKKKASKL